jgi:hypothetical protein
VLLGKAWAVQLEGELSGVKGDAFRLIVPFPLVENAAKARKVELRPAEKKAEEPGKKAG